MGKLTEVVARSRIRAVSAVGNRRSAEGARMLMKILTRGDVKMLTPARCILRSYRCVEITKFSNYLIYLCDIILNE